ncbi:hypothetical protein V6Z11_D08G071800 [Gossypium hirsutum]
MSISWLSSTLGCVGWMNLLWFYVVCRVDGLLYLYVVCREDEAMFGKFHVLKLDSACWRSRTNKGLVWFKGCYLEIQLSFSNGL